ncbi:hypothetical protein M9H77_20081 [Catharanthus roseus]|uniref:Uncharacterized protein n=1 Tax=Catharanthus roseus TaxID=4058 RepID=A0ACC0AMV4_CATRO|nr:hypothetical protein M9H77_20081 [Catharanthus roseus]
MANNKATIYLSFAFVILFILSMAESRALNGGLGATQTISNQVVVCDKIYGAQSGDNCFSIALQFNLTTEFFASLNPNLNCNHIFIGEWLCVDGVTF